MKYEFNPISWRDIQNALSSNCRSRRLEKNISLKGLSKDTTVPVSTIQRFERTGEISLKSFIKLAIGLGYAKELFSFMDKPKYSSLDEMIKINKNKGRKRGTGE